MQWNAYLMQLIRFSEYENKLGQGHWLITVNVQGYGNSYSFKILYTNLEICTEITHKYFASARTYHSTRF